MAPCSGNYNICRIARRARDLGRLLTVVPAKPTSSHRQRKLASHLKRYELLCFSAEPGCGTCQKCHSEELISRVIAGQRDHVFLVSKVLPSHVTGNGVARACEASLARLGTDHLDLYLLHWRNGITDLSGVVKSFEDLRAAGKIRAWGVSNFTARDMDDLFHTLQGDRCATNQVPYSIGDRGIEPDLLPWCERHGMPVMAYSPLGGPGASLSRDPTLARIGAARGCSAAAVALAWTMRSGNVIAIPESGSPAHVKENAAALSLTLTPQELQTLDAAHPPPGR